MNNKGFTLIEVLCVIFLISILFVASFLVVKDTLSITDEKAYQILKENIISQTKTYIDECENNIINCKKDFEWKKVNDNKIAYINLSLLKKYNYFDNDEIINPLTKKDMSSCLKIKVIKDKYSSISIFLDESECQKRK